MFRKIKRITIYSKYLNTNQRFLTTVPKSKIKTTINPAKKSVLESKVYQHFLNSTQKDSKTALKFPNEFFATRMGKMPDNFYIANKNVALDILKELQKDLPSEKIIIENSPGIGLLTQLLIEKTSNDLFIFEGAKQFHYFINDILDHYPRRKIYFKHNDFGSSWDLWYLDHIEGTTKLIEIFENFQRKNFEDDTVARMFTCAGTEKFFNNLIKSVIFQNGLFHAGRIEMFLCIPPTVYFKMASSPKAGPFFYQASSVLFQLLFEYEFIMKIDRKCFLPWRTKPPKDNTAEAKIISTDFDFIYLIRIEPRRDLIKYFLQKDFTALWFFIKHHMGNKKIVSSMEEWIPGISAILTNTKKTIEKPEILFPESRNTLNFNFVTPSTKLSKTHFIEDLNEFTEFNTLAPTQVLTLFNQFINLPEYENSAFNHALEKMLKSFYINQDLIEEDNFFLDFSSKEDETKIS